MDAIEEFFEDVRSALGVMDNEPTTPSASIAQESNLIGLVFYEN
jgi:hypothetical protein